MDLAIIWTGLWLGILTAISPCPLTTNIAAISFIGGKSGRKSQVFMAGVLYATGRTIAYISLGMLIIGGTLSSSEASLFLQAYMNEALGPIMILLGLILLNWIDLGISFSLHSNKLQQKAQAGGLLWAFPMGAIFALSFCPVSAGLFFGGLLPLALKHSASSLMLIAVYGLGTAIPVIFFAGIMAFASHLLGKIFGLLTTIEKAVRTFAGAFFILAGLYYCWVYIFAAGSK